MTASRSWWTAPVGRRLRSDQRVPSWRSRWNLSFWLSVQFDNFSLNGKLYIVFILRVNEIKTKAHLVRNFPISDTVVACSYLDYQQPSTNSQVGSFLSRRSQMTWQCLKMLLDPLNKLGHQASAMLDSILERIDEEHGFLSADQFGPSDAVCFHCWGPSLFDADDN